MTWSIFLGSRALLILAEEHHPHTLEGPPLYTSGYGKDFRGFILKRLTSYFPELGFDLPCQDLMVLVVLLGTTLSTATLFQTRKEIHPVTQGTLVLFR